MALTLLLLLSALFFQVARPTIQLPPPSGPCRVQATPAKLVDTSRIDPYSPGHHHRALMVTSYVPIRCNETQHGPRAKTTYTSYLPPQTAKTTDKIAGSFFGFPGGLLEQFQIGSCAAEPTPVPEDTEYPVIIFSGAFGASRLIYGSLLESIASNGFVVVSVDHPYDAAVVEFPEGQAIYSSKPVPGPFLIDVRVQDVMFTLDQLHDSESHILPPSFPGKLHLDKVAAVGHSMGGATAAQVMVNDTRFAGGMNLDGKLFDPVMQQGFKQPFVNIAEAGYPAEVNTTWPLMWPHLRGFKQQLRLKHSKHQTFTDFPLLRDSGGLSAEAKQATSQFLGSMPGLRVRQILTDYITAACSYFITGTMFPLLEGPLDEYPEVEFMTP